MNAMEWSLLTGGAVRDECDRADRERLAAVFEEGHGLYMGRPFRIVWDDEESS